MPATKDQILLEPVPRFEGRYSVSSTGGVFSHISGRYLRLKPHSAGYLSVSLSDGNGIIHDALVHRLVCAAFHGECADGKPCVNHINGIKTDNRPENLEWCSRSENNRHAVRLGLTKAQRIAVAKSNRRRAKPVVGTFPNGSEVWFPSISEARKAGFAKVSDCLLGHRKTTGGATWRYA